MHILGVQNAFGLFFHGQKCNKSQEKSICWKGCFLSLKYSHPLYFLNIVSLQLNLPSPCFACVFICKTRVSLLHFGEYLSLFCLVPGGWKYCKIPFIRCLGIYPQPKVPFLENKGVKLKMRFRDAFSSKSAVSSGYRVSHKEACGLNVSSSLLEIS